MYKDMEGLEGYTVKRRAAQRRGAQHICIHNEAVECTGGECGKCGWNPAEAKRRLRKYLRRKRKCKT